MRNAPDIREQLRQAIIDAPGSRYDLARYAGVSQTTVSHFVRGLRGMNLDSAARLAEILKLTLRPRHTTRKRPAGVPVRREPTGSRSAVREAGSLDRSDSRP